MAINSLRLIEVTLILSIAMSPLVSIASANYPEQGNDAVHVEIHPSQIEIQQGTTNTVTVTIRSLSPHPQTVTISWSLPLPPNSTITALPNVVRIAPMGQANSTLTISIGSVTPPGNYLLHVVATGSLEPAPLLIVVSGSNYGFSLFDVMGVLALVLGVLTVVLVIRGKKRSYVSILEDPIQIGSEIGIREVNEDSAAAIRTSVMFRSRTRMRALMVLADGMGGHASGEIASSLCVKTITQYLHPFLETSADQDLRTLLTDSISKANASILRASAEEGFEGMGTTVVVAVLDQLSIHVAWVGDSRAYLVSRGVIKPLTRDHSRVQDLIDKGSITPEQARVHPDRNVITRSVGRRETVKVDYLCHELRTGDRSLLLCSDGLTDAYNEQQVSLIMNQSSTPAEAVWRLLAPGKRQFGDNVTVIIADLASMRVPGEMAS